MLLIHTPFILKKFGFFLFLSFYVKMTAFGELFFGIFCPENIIYFFTINITSVFN